MSKMKKWKISMGPFASRHSLVSDSKWKKVDNAHSSSLIINKYFYITIQLCHKSMYVYIAVTMATWMCGNSNVYARINSITILYQCVYVCDKYICVYTACGNFESTHEAIHSIWHASLLMLRLPYIWIPCCKLTIIQNSKFYLHLSHYLWI